MRFRFLHPLRIACFLVPLLLQCNLGSTSSATETPEESSIEIIQKDDRSRQQPDAAETSKTTFGIVRKKKDGSPSPRVVVDSPSGTNENADGSGTERIKLDGDDADEVFRNAVLSFYKTPSSSSSISSLEEAINKKVHSPSTNMFQYIQTMRRTLHRMPEILYDEHKTSSTIASMLDSMPGLTYTTGWAVNTHVGKQMPGKGGTGIVAQVGTGKPPCVLLRADIDGLPIVEAQSTVYKSATSGRMHACGHDGHSSMLIGAARVLSSVSDAINGTVRIIFQPAEEGGAGAKRMIEEGVLEVYPPVQAAYGMHLWPTLPSGSIGGRPGVGFAAADMFTVTLTGVGGHAAMPHLTKDPVVAASATVTALQTIVARNLSPLDAGVVSVTYMKTGEPVYNVIPETVTLGGTVRSLSENGLLQLKQSVERVAIGVAQSHDCTVSVQWSFDYYPPVINDGNLWENMIEGIAGRVARVGPRKVNDIEENDGSSNKIPDGSKWDYIDGGAGVTPVEPTMGGEDFSFIANAVPSSFLLLGQGTGEALIDDEGANGKGRISDSNEGGLRGTIKAPTNYGLHHPKFAMDESVLPLGVELHVNLALQTIKAMWNEKESGASNSKLFERGSVLSATN